MRKPALDETRVISDEHLYVELWTSLASLLRSYTAAHGLHRGHHARVESSEDKITARHGEKQLILTRNHQSVTWTRENGDNGTLGLTENGHLRGLSSEEAMDLAAEHWARELMQ
jgi:hypothetical protein